MNYVSVAVLLMTLSVTSFAEEAEDMDKSLSPVARHLQTMQQEAWPEPNETMQGTVKFVVGNDAWHPGQQFRNGNEWLALVCKSVTCSLEPAALKVKQDQWMGHYDDAPTSGQLLSFTRKGAQSGEAVAWFYTGAPHPWLKSGGVPTYYAPQSPLKQPKGKGTLEALVDLPKGGAAVLLPMMLPAGSALSVNGGGPSFLLQLRAEGKRQLLLGYLGECYGTVESRRYLQWAGDLDRDGKADYLISFVDEEGPVHLYLSSLARSGQLVGLAGVYVSPPFGGECGGE